MNQLRGNTRKNLMMLTLLTLMATLALGLTGCGGGSGSGGAGPVFSQVSVFPALLAATGGTVTITATVVDGDGVQEVEATISCEGRHATALLTNVGGDIYQGTYTAPPNTGLTDQIYTVALTALDALANQSNSADYNFTVLSPY